MVNAWSASGVGEPSIVERAAAVLRDEIANGALDNIAASSRVWSAQRPGLIGSEVSRRLRAELEGLLAPLLDLLAPPKLASSPRPVDSASNHRSRGQQSLETLPVLRSLRSVAPGGTAEIITRLQNDGPQPIEVGLVCSDLVAEPGRRILAECVRLRPGQVRLSPGDVVDLAIGLVVPADAQPGLYHALLQATDLAGLRAILTFPVG